VTPAPEQLAQALGCTLQRLEPFLPHLLAAAAVYRVDTALRWAHLCAQLGHESGGLRHTREIWGPTPAQARYEGRRDLGNGSITQGATVSDAYAALVGDVGSRTQSAQFLSEVSTTVVQEAESSRDGEAGVNLDEEAARLLQFQQAYQASARILQVAQATFSELLGSIR
jgi:hypothetical protein